MNYWTWKRMDWESLIRERARAGCSFPAIVALLQALQAPRFVFYNELPRGFFGGEGFECQGPLSMYEDRWRMKAKL